MTVSIEGTTPGIAVDGTGAVVNVTVTTGAGGGGGGVELGETSTTAYRGDRGKTAYDHSQVVSGNPHGTTAADVGADPAGTAAGLVDDLSGVSNQSTARSNLGLGTAAVSASTDFAAASHTHAASAVTSGTLDAARLATGTATNGYVIASNSGTPTWSPASSSGIADPGGANDDFLQRKSGAWTNRTIAQVKTDLGLAPIPGITNWYTDNLYSGLQGLNHTSFGGGGTAVVLGANLLWFWKIMPVETINVDGGEILGNTDGASGTFFRIGIYAHSVTAGPTGAPLVDSGNISAVVGSGNIATGSWTAVTLNAWTQYWSCIETNDASFAPRGLYRANDNGRPAEGLDVGATDSSNHVIMRVAHTYGTLPVNPAPAFTTASVARPGVLWKTRRI